MIVFYEYIKHMYAFIYFQDYTECPVANFQVLLDTHEQLDQKEKHIYC